MNATSGSVSVDEYDLYAGGDGTTAASTATIGLGITQAATQKNANEATATGTTVVQNQAAVPQTNVSTQTVGLAAATAVADYVDLGAYSLHADGNGITANSAGVAALDINQTAGQENSNKATATGTTAGSPPPVTSIAQTQGVVLQNNVSTQTVVAATSTAGSDYVAVEAFDLSAGGDGIAATSSATAAMGITQAATQKNSNEATGTGTSVTQTQAAPAQTNISTQTIGAAASTAVSESVSVFSSSELVPVLTLEASDKSKDKKTGLKAKGDGIKATSAAVAAVELAQTAGQENGNKATANAGAGTATQTQLAIPQTNVSTQTVAAAATTAASSYVTVEEYDLYAGGDGITAASTATAALAITQAATQKNANEATATGAKVLQTQGTVPQTNESRQIVGVAAATAVADYVDVGAYSLHADGNGITANSAGVAALNINQTAGQENSNKATATGTTAGTPPPVTTIVQTQGVITQSNTNTQVVGLAASTAASDYVDVEAFDVSAGGDGIAATSAATAALGITQAATQKNSNAVTGTGTSVVQTQPALTQTNTSTQTVGVAAATSASGPVTVFSSGEPLMALSSEESYKNIGLDAKGNGISATSAATAAASVNQTAGQTNENGATATGNDVIQTQLGEQLNQSIQSGILASTAVSGEVSVDSHGLKAGENGITATSVATAAAALNQSADQTNTNAAAATLQLPPTVIIGLDLRDLASFETAGSQNQFLGQTNINVQKGASVATAGSGRVSVYSDDITVLGNGLSATSSAVSAAGISQAATQKNENSAAITLPAARIVPDDAIPIPQTEIAAQIEGIAQVNLNVQLGASVATSISNDVFVQNSDLLAGADGISAVSSATSVASLSQSANQSNKDTKTIIRAEGDGPSSGEIAIQPSTTALQLEAILQVNASDQLGTAVATSVSGPVTVVSGAGPVLLASEEGKSAPKGGVEADGTAIAAKSSAEAAAPLVQTVTQANENTFDATGNTIVQLQLAGQVNLSSQGAGSIATAFADEVLVDQFGTATAWSGDGISAASSAKATALVSQTATQSNANKATAEAEPSSPAPIIPTVAELVVDNGLSAAVQAQFVGQLNLSEQNGLAVATAVSRSVTVSSENASSGGNGITAISSADASAPVVQTATQSNTNEATATFTPPPVDISIITDGGVDASFSQIFGGGLALQIQLVGQANLSGQSGVAVATALSDPVTVTQSGYLESGAGGITATSSANATAPVVQTATQTNTNSAAVTFEGGELEVLAEGTGDIEVGVQQLGGDDLALQGQLVGQLNLSSQRGAAIATAIADDVTVHQNGELTAWGGDGIAATSSAVASAPVVQTATQTNENSATATFEGHQASLGVNAVVDPEAEELPELPDAFGTITQADGVDVAVQGQLVGQVNLSSQRGLAVATAVSGEVVVTSSYDPASGNGIEAISSAEASAPVVQTATQSNKNSATAIFGGDVANVAASAAGEAVGQITQSDGGLRLEADGLDLALQGQLVGQVNLSGQGGLAIATALSDPVSVEQCCYLEAGEGGIVAKSTANATAPVVQTATQSNLNSAAASFEGDIANYGTDEVPVEGGSLATGSISQSDGIDLALQGQLVGQVNVSFQRGAAIATAISDEVSVYQGGELTAWGGNGITAVSSSEALAPVVQTATQTNTNEAAATFGGSTAGLVVSQTDADEPTPALEQEETGAGGSIQQEPGLDVALQGQLVGQVNLSGQRGLAVATAVSGEVVVIGSNDPASGDGIRAVSSAEATAPVAQTATQSNENSATATFDGSQSEISATAGEVVDAGIAQTDGLDLALQGQLVGQVNLSGQSGLAIATALSDPVSVEQCCILEAGKNGVVAEFVG